ncbi:MAG: radical SAM protein, partial [Candidatus Margulisbacteria bacterium]|nr:radical SAM protein [Candidatus Margulisiibacteriota bacterium]
MKIALVASGYESLGLESLSARLKAAGHEVRLFFDPKSFGGGIFLKIDFLNNFFDLKNKIIEQALLWQPDIIGFSCMTHNYHWSLDIAREIKKRKNIPIIFGGMQPTLLPEAVIAQKCVDYVAVGEAETSFSVLLERMSQGEDVTAVDGIYAKNGQGIVKNRLCPLIGDLDSLPFADKELFYDKMPMLKNVAYSIMASRGCLFACSYCCNDYLKRIYKDGHFYRMRSVDNVIAELKLAKQKHKIKSVVFYDEVFPSAIPWLQEFAAKYKQEVDLPFVIYYHFKLCTRERLLLLKQAGCKGLGFGLQSTSERIRREILNRQENNEQVRGVVALCQELGLTVNIDHIFG